jgi:hypothetical protein
MDEEAIKAQLRTLTEQTRKLRTELEEILHPPTHSGTRARLHVQLHRPARGHSPEPVGRADEKPHGRRTRR